MLLPANQMLPSMLLFIIERKRARRQVDYHVQFYWFAEISINKSITVDGYTEDHMV